MTLSLSKWVSQSVSDILIWDRDGDGHGDADADADADIERVNWWISDLVAQLTIPDKLRNLIHDIEGYRLQSESDLDSIHNSCDVLNL